MSEEKVDIETNGEVEKLHEVVNDEQADPDPGENGLSGNHDAEKLIQKFSNDSDADAQNSVREISEGSLEAVNSLNDEGEGDQEEYEENEEGDEEEGEEEEDGEEDDDDDDDEDNEEDSTKKKIYSMEFLLQFKSSNTQQPPNLPSVAIIKNQNKQGGGGSKGGNRGGRKKGGRSKQTPNRPKTPQNLPPVEPLQVSENRWERPKHDMTTEEGKNEAVLHAANGLLNKLTKEKFKELSEKLLECITNASILEGIINLIFTKATTEPKFATMYADLCKYFHTNAPKYGTITFGRLLLTKCQQLFETKPEVAEDTNLNELEREFQANKIKQTYLGNIRFIGELYKQNMLKVEIMKGCVARLLGMESIPDMDNLESLCKLLSTTGELLDKADNKFVTFVMDRLEDISTDEEVEPRYRFMIKDLIELRKNKWIARRKQEGPKKISEVHEDAKREDARQEAQSRVLLGRSVDSSLPVAQAPRRLVSPGPGASRNSEESEWQTVKKPNGQPPSNQRNRKGGGRQGGGGGGGGGGRKRGGGGGDWRTQSMDTSKDPRRPSSAQGGNNPGRMSSLDRNNSAPVSNPVNMFSALSDTKDTKNINVPKATQVGRSPILDDEDDEQGAEKGEAAEKGSAEGSEDSLVRNCEQLLGEYWCEGDLQEAVNCVKEFKNSKQQRILIREGINLSLEKKEKERSLTVDLIGHLIKEKVLLEDEVTHGLQEIFDALEDIKLDYPFCVSYVGNIIARAISLQMLSLIYLKNSVQHLKESGIAIESFVEVIKALISLTSVEEAKRIKDESGVSLDDFGILNPIMKGKLSRDVISKDREKCNRNDLC